MIKNPLNEARIREVKKLIEKIIDTEQDKYELEKRLDDISGFVKEWRDQLDKLSEYMNCSVCEIEEIGKYNPVLANKIVAMHFKVSGIIHEIRYPRDRRED